MADENLNVSPEEYPQPSLFDTGPADAPAPETSAPEPPAPENIPEQAAVDAPAQDAPAGAPGEVSVSADQIEKLMAERRAAERAEVEKNEPPEPEQPPTPAPEEKAAGEKGPAKKDKAAKEKMENRIYPAEWNGDAVYLTLAPYQSVMVAFGYQGEISRRLKVGRRICPPYQFDISGYVKEGANTLVVEVATTLERAVKNLPADPKDLQRLMFRNQVGYPFGLLGKAAFHWME